MSEANAQKRRFARHALQVDFKSHDSKGELHFTGADLSVGGSFVRADLLLEQGEQLALEFRVPGVPRPMRAQGRVAWVRRFPEPSQPGGMGFEFLAMTEEDRAVLAEYLAAS
jgi:uncharacterized protein (TIGR02266 family)